VTPAIPTLSQKLQAMRATAALPAQILILIVALNATCTAIAGDWRFHRHDIRRSGTTAESLSVEILSPLWLHRASQRPAPAWPGPARWDAYANIRGLQHMRDYDTAFQITIAGDSLYFGSSVDDCLHCISTTTGERRWWFATDGPIRIAPSIVNDRVYFGSDDGHAYCLSAADGSLIWKSELPYPHPERKILNNGRMISSWPCRTGVLVDQDIAYFGLSMLPWRESWLCAVDASTGQAEGARTFTRRLGQQTLEGGLLLNDKQLVALRGRVEPFVFARADGADVGELQEGGGGVFATMTEDGELLHGPGNKTGWITRSRLETQEQQATYLHSTKAVRCEENLIMLSDRGVAAVSQPTGRVLWEQSFTDGCDIIAAGPHIFVGGQNEVAALQCETGTIVWRAAVTGTAACLAVADGKLFASTDAGTIHCFAPNATEPWQRAGSSPSTAPVGVAQAADFSSDIGDGIRRNNLTGRWIFHSGMGQRARRRGLPDPERRVQDLTGTRDGIVLGDVNLREVGGVQALELDGSTNSVLIVDDLPTTSLPQQALSVEAWVRVDAPLTWGGIVSAIQDNGSFERGWCLGFRGSQFCFGIAANGGPDRLTYLSSPTEFEKQRWYHVVGTYDGFTQNLFVDGQLAASATEQSGPINYPASVFLELGAYHDDDEYHRMTGMLHEAAIYNRSLSSSEVTALHQQKSGRFPIPGRLASGPVLRFTGTSSAIIEWETETPSPTMCDVFGPGIASTISNPEPVTKHSARVEGLPVNRMCYYRIRTHEGEQETATVDFELDTSFNYSIPALDVSPPALGESHREPTAHADAALQKMAGHLLQTSQWRQGICLVIGLRDGSLPCELARQSQLRVICVDTDAERIARARRLLIDAGVYGNRVSAMLVPSFDELPLVGQFANLIVSERQLLDNELVMDAAEVVRVLRPYGGVACLHWPTAMQPPAADSIKDWFGSLADTVTFNATELGTTVTYRRPALVDGGVWSHLYGRADNSAFGGETLSGATTVGELKVQWVGRPGPRAQPDRNGRKPAPLSINGRLFIQGLHRLIGVDAMNGTPLWTLEIPELQRFNMPRDCGNWCADADRLFVAVERECWEIAAQTGEILHKHRVLPGDREEWDYDWSYVARVGDLLLGSAVKEETAFTNFWGNADAGWYDARSGPATFKVCSENLFALQPGSGERLWSYANGLIINSTITATSSHVYFVSCRHAGVKASAARRVGVPELWDEQYLVCLETSTGRVAWERPLDTENGEVVFTMAHSGQQLYICASADLKYHVYGISATDGEPLWNQSFDWPGGKGDHGKAMSRPAIVGDVVYVRPHALNTKDGSLLPLKMPGGGCGTYAATTDALFFRSGNVTAWNTVSGSTTSWNRLRPGCWLSTIPGSGMLLSPEAGGGCSCGSWLETSVGFMPARRDRKPDLATSATRN
jgi:outer membrane protein assembly factor BamB